MFITDQILSSLVPLGTESKRELERVLISLTSSFTVATGVLVLVVDILYEVSDWKVKYSGVKMIMTMGEKIAHPDKMYLLNTRKDNYRWIKYILLRAWRCLAGGERVVKNLQRSCMETLADGER